MLQIRLVSSCVSVLLYGNEPLILCHTGFSRQFVLDKDEIWTRKYIAPAYMLLLNYDQEKGVDAKAQEERGE